MCFKIQMKRNNALGNGQNFHFTLSSLDRMVKFMPWHLNNWFAVATGMGWWWRSRRRKAFRQNFARSKLAWIFNRELQLKCNFTHISESSSPAKLEPRARRSRKHLIHNFAMGNLNSDWLRGFFRLASTESHANRYSVDFFCCFSWSATQYRQQQSLLISLLNRSACFLSSSHIFMTLQFSENVVD